MIDLLKITNFTVFENVHFKFGEGLNVVVGANGTGKTHMLKVAYAVSSACASYTSTLGTALASISRLDDVFDEFINHDLTGQFPANTLSDLVRRPNRSSEGMSGATVVATIKGVSGQLEFVVDSVTKNQLSLKQKPDIKVQGAEPVFIPAKEVLTLGWLLNYSQYGTPPKVEDLNKLPIDRAYVNLLHKLIETPFDLPNPPISQLLGMIKAIVGGGVEYERGSFFLVPNNQPRMEMNIVAEGIRKFATLYKLLANGTLTPGATLFWDEPDTNLNPILLKEMAAVLTELAKAGFQIILATHSLFLLKELQILAQREKQPAKYFALYAGENGATQVETKDDFIQLEHVAALDAELTQTFDFEDALDQDYAGDS